MNTSLFPLLALLLAALPLLAQPTINEQPTNRIVLSGANVIFSVTASGSGPLSYKWRKDGTNLNLITTVAGGGTHSPGDDGAATDAGLGNPFRIGFDAQGDLYIADTMNNRIRRVDASGIITTVAGSTNAGYSGDGAAATNASLYRPEHVAFDSMGNLYFPELNQRVRKVDTNGTITTVAGNGSRGYSGDGGMATNASLNAPVSVAFDRADNLYIADYGNYRIRRVDTNGIIKTVVGNGLQYFFGDGGPATNSTLYGPQGVTIDNAGNLYIADDVHERVRKVDASGIITTVAGNGTAGYSGDGGLAINAKLYYPYSVAKDPSGNLYIADEFDNSTRKVDTNGIITTVAGIGNAMGLGGYSGDGGEAPLAYLHGPTGLALDPAGNLYLADNYNSRIREVGLAGLAIPSLTLFSVTSSNATDYKVVISGSSGSVTSSVVTLAVVYPIVPANLTVTNGDPAGFSVAAYGTGTFYYQWYFNTNEAIVDATNSSLFITNTTYDHRGAYSCVVSNASGAVTTGVSTLTVRSAPVIAVQPANQTVLKGNNALFAVGVSGSAPLRYQWFFNTNTRMVGETNATVIVTNASSAQAGDYNCVVTNLYGSATSATGTLTVALAPTSFSATRTNGNALALRLTGMTNYPYILEVATNLTPPINWQVVVTNLTDDHGCWSLTATDSCSPSVFYRASGR